jgi:hypothetical protein
MHLNHMPQRLQASPCNIRYPVGCVCVCVCVRPPLLPLLLSPNSTNRLQRYLAVHRIQVVSLAFCFTDNLTLSVPC